MPKKSEKKIYKETFKTEGQRVVGDGTEIVMSNGRRFKRTVLPSVATRSLKTADEQEVDLTYLDNPSVQEQEQA